MDLRWERSEAIRTEKQQSYQQQQQQSQQQHPQHKQQQEDDAWESNSSDESSVGDYEGADMIMMPQPELDIDDEFSTFNFPRDDLVVLLDGLNKWPWTVYPIQLTNCLVSAGKIASLGMEETCSEHRRLQTLYRDAVPSAFEKCLGDKAIWKWPDEIHNNIFDALCRLMDLVVAKLLQQEGASCMEDLLPLLRSLSIGFDKQSQYHLKHKEQSRLSGPAPGSVSRPGKISKFAKPLSGSSTSRESGDKFCPHKKGTPKETEVCDCSRCRPPDVYCWLSHLLNYFGQTVYGNGYHQLLRVLSSPHKITPALLEVVLLIVSKSVEFLTDDVADLFAEPCNKVLHYVAEKVESDVDALSDKTKDGSFSTLSSILKHLQVIIACNTSPEQAESVVSIVQRRLVERMLSFQSFNKQLSAVREINKVLENARAIASKDNYLAISTTISWMEKMDIIRQVLRSHLHHKQYVDQVQKIMRFLLQEKRLSEGHLDAVWAASEKPDQFEAVKTNIFDLIADLACSFSPEQLDSLFGRFERCQGHSAFDIGKLLTLVKKLARSDTKGIMASRLLELLWKLMMLDEAPGEILESGAFTEILGHYDSMNCASKDVYMARCLANIKEERLVIPSLRLLRDFIWLDHEKPFYQVHLQQLIKDHDLLNMVVSSLEKYVAGARLVLSASGSDSVTIEVLSPFFSHDEQLKERLDFLLFILRSSGVSLPWSSGERLWNCVIETPPYEGDKESGFRWFCDALDKRTLLTLDAQTNILTKKLPMIDPSSLSQAAWRCFLRLFLWVNQSKDKIKLKALDERVTLDLDLVGLPYLWWIALCSPQEPIVDQSISLLREIHTSLCDTLQENLVEIRQQFIDKCLEFLEKALEVGGVKWSEASDCSSTASCSMGEGLSEGTEKLDDKDSLISKLIDGDVMPERKGLDMGTRFFSEARQVEHCLRILRIFITRCEGRCPRSIPPHTASFQGRPFLLGVSTASKQSTRFDVTVHTNEYLSSVRAKVAKLLDQPRSRIRLTYQNRELLYDSEVLWQCGLTGGQTITASVNSSERITNFPDEQQLPGILMSKNIKFYDTLFRLAIASDTSVRENANSLLALLPTHPAILAGFQDLCTKSAEEGRSFLAAHFGARDRLLYTLQVLDGLVMPVNQPADMKTHKFRTSFIHAGGVQHLLSILEPEALPEGVDNQTRRGCYASSLRLLKFLLSEKFDCDDISVPVSEVTDIARGDGMSENQEALDKISEGTGVSFQLYKELLEQQGVKELSDVVDMASVVAALRRITWAAAAGQLSIMGSCSPVASAPKMPSGKSAKKRAFPDDDDGVLDPEDQYLFFEAMDFLMLCLLKHKYLWRPFFTSYDTENFIVALLLHSPDTSVRYRAAVNLMRLSGTKHGVDHVARKHVVAALLGAKAEAALHPKRCSHFWELLAQLFCTIEDVEDRKSAQQQLDDELQWLQSAPSSVDDDDRLLEGHLHLIKVLVGVLGCRIIGTSKCQQGRGLIKLLMRDFLFPDCASLLSEEDGPSLRKVSASGVQLGMFGVVSEERSLLQAKCSTRGSRERAFQLLICLATHCKEGFQEVVELIKRIHLAEQVEDWEHLPSYGRKALGGYVGLKNAGATCYMNSVFQQLFMQPEVRRSVLACTECDDGEKSGSVFFQLQAMFGALLGSSLDHYTPQGFWCAYRDYDGMPINLREHQDAFEFFNRLYDAIDETLKATHQETTLTRIFGGVFAQQIICRGCPHRSEREEPFAAISVDVKNKKDLTESLEAFVRGDLLEGDNAYHCAECGVKVDALKRVCVKSLPHTLVIHLKRFDFDYETMQRLKLKDRFEFPTHIDMKPYTVEGLALRESQSVLSPKGVIDTSGTGNKIDDATNLLKPDHYYNYDLVGVVVHSGTAFAGHYYSYIKQRPGDQPLNCGHGQSSGWIVFDDKNVEPYDAKDLEKDCFGGKYAVDVYDNFSKTTAPQEFDRPNSAYMLLYERSSVELVSACSPAQTAMSLSKAEDEDGDEFMKDISLCDRLPSLRNIQMPASVHRSVWQENLRFIHENHLMDKDYFRFILRLVEANLNLLDSRCVSTASEHLEGSQSACEPGNGEAGALDATEVNHFVKVMTVLASEFLLKIFLRTHSSLRQDLLLWKSLLCKLFERSTIACRTFIEALVQHPHWIQDYLVKCPVEEIQQFFASMLVQVLRCAVLFSHGSSILAGAHGQATETLHENTLIDILLSFLRDPTLPKYSCHQYFQVILEYAKLGSVQRFYLLNKSALSQLVNTTVTFASKVNFQVAKLEFGCLHSLVSLLLQSCDISQFQNLSGFNSEKTSCLSEENGDTVKPLPAPPNPFQLPPPHFLLPKETLEAVFKQHMYIAVLIETCSEYEEAVKLLELLCWNNESFTMWVLQDLLEALHRTANNDAKPLLVLFSRILLLEDSLQKLRQKIILLGPESTRLGIMSLIVTRVMSTQKRYLLFKFVVKLMSACPDTKVHVRERASDWKLVVDWLQDEIQTPGLGSNAMITLSASNEDMSNGHLQRTSSAEWTLVNSRSVFES